MNSTIGGDCCDDLLGRLFAEVIRP